MYMPPNVTPLIQPMDQNALRLTKLFYRKHLLSTILLTKDNIQEGLKKLSLKDAVINLSSAWDKLNPAVIKKCWNNVLSNSNAAFDEEDDLPLSELRRKWKIEEDDTVVDAITLLKTIEPQQYTAEDIDEWNRDTSTAVEEDVQDISDESENENQDHEENTVTHPAAMEALQTLLTWATCNGLDVSDIISLKNMYEKAVLLNASVKRVQTKITSYFVNNNKE